MSAFVRFLDGENNPKALPVIFIFSVAAHIILFVIIPIIFSLTWKPRILSRPPTFELVKIQVPQPQRQRSRPIEQPRPVETPPPAPVEAPVKPVEAPKPTEAPKPVVQEPKIEPKKQETPTRPREVAQTKPVETSKPVEEDVSELESMFADNAPATATAAAVSSVSALTAEPFEYQWYLDQLQSRIRSRWKPAANETGEVVVQFVISRNGSMSDLKLTKPSGRTILDRQAQQAVQMSAPFAPLPSGFSGQSLTVNLTLKPSR